MGRPPLITNGLATAARSSLDDLAAVAACLLVLAGGRIAGEVGLGSGVGAARRAQSDYLDPVVVRSEAFFGDQPRDPLRGVVTGMFLDASAAPTQEVIVAMRRTEPVGRLSVSVKAMHQVVVGQDRQDAIDRAQPRSAATS